MDATLTQETLIEQEKQALIPFKKNEEALAELQQENEQLAAGWAVLVTATAATYFFVPLVGPGAAGAGWAISTWTSWRATKVIRLLQIIKLLLETFGSKGVEIYPRIPVEGMNPIDLFVRFPKKTHLFISIRSKGESKIAYDEAKEILYVRRKNGRVNKWEPNPLVELADHERWLAKNKDLFGMSSKEAQKTPTAKVLLLWHPTKAAQHREELYSEMGAVKPLVLRRKGSAFVIQKEELINFIQAWLAKYE